MAATIKYGDTKWAVKDGNTLGYNDENRFKPVPFDFTRNSIGTRVDRNGLIETIGNNIPRIDFTDNTDGHLLLEPQSTNLITYSEDFEDSSWSNASVGTTPTLEGGYTAPDGSNNAYKISNANQDSFWYSSSVIGADNSRTIWARTVSGTGTAQLTSHNSNTNNTFNLTETWQRFEVNGTTSGIGSTNFYAVDFRGSGTLTELLIWGGQSEALTYATSYIPTNGSTVTRASETCTNAGNSTLINSTEGVLYAEIAGLVDADTSDRVISLSDNSITNRVEMKLSSSGSIQGRFDSASSDITLTETGLTASNFNKIALIWSSGKCALFINGVKEQEDLTFNTFASDVLFDLSFDSAYLGGSSNFYGEVKALTVYNTALTDAELIELTS